MRDKFWFIAFISMLLPPVLMALNPHVNGFSFIASDPALLPMNWLYMSAPILLVVGVSAVAPRLRKTYALPTLVSLAIALVLFQSWVWWLVPQRERSLAWVLYFPFCLVVLAATVALVYVKHRLRSEP